VNTFIWMKALHISMATLWVDLSDGKTQISGTKPTPKSVPVHEIVVNDKKQTLVYKSTIPDFYSSIVRVLMAKQMQKGQCSMMENFPDFLVLYFHKDRDRDRIAQMAMTCSYFDVGITPNVLSIAYDVNATPLDIDQAVDIEKYDIDDLNKGNSGMLGGGGGGKKGPPGPPGPGPGPPPEPKPDPKKWNEENPPLDAAPSEGGEGGEGSCEGGECSGEGSGAGQGEGGEGQGSGEGGEGSGEGSGDGSGEGEGGEGSGEGEGGEGSGEGGQGEGQGSGEGQGAPGDATTSEDGKPNPCEECSQEAKDQNMSLDPETDSPEDAMEKAKAATDAALEAEAKADPDSESDKKAVDEAKEAAKEAIDKAREVNNKDWPASMTEKEVAENDEALDDMEDSLTTDFEKLAQDIQEELDMDHSESEEDGEISNMNAMDLVRKLIKLKALASPQDREEVIRIESEIIIKIEGE